MKQILLPMTLVAALTAAPLAAQDEDGGPSLMEQGMKLFFKGLMTEMEPALEELEGLAQEMEPALRDFALNMGPALRGLMDEVDDWSNYHLPEVLPNGDIIIRRKVADEPREDCEIEL
jgi:hypothetical protein